MTNIAAIEGEIVENLSIIDSIESAEIRYQTIRNKISEYKSKVYESMKNGEKTYFECKEQIDKFIQQETLKDNPYKEIITLVDKLCIAYSDANKNTRARVRKTAKTRDKVNMALFRYAYKAADKINSADDVELFKKGVIAMSIENAAIDFRDTYIAIADLYVTAEAAGINAQVVFEEVAKISSQDKHTYSDKLFNKALSEFYTQPVVAERRREGVSSMRQEWLKDY